MTTSTNSSGVLSSITMLTLGIASALVCVTAAWSWYMRFILEVTPKNGPAEISIIILPPALKVYMASLVIVLSVLALIFRYAFITKQLKRVRDTGCAMLLFGIAFLIGLRYSHDAVPTDPAMIFFWQTAIPVLALMVVFFIARLIYDPLKSFISRLHNLKQSRLWLLFFILVHIPSFWFAQPWKPSFYRHQHLGGDEPRYLLMTHSLAKDRDFNLYNQWTHNNRNSYICPTNPYRDPGDEFYARRAREKWNAGKPQSTAEYWHEKRYGIERLGLPVVLAPAYKAGFEIFRRHRYAVVFMLNIILVFTMANIYLLALNLTHRKSAALLSAITAGLSGPLLFYGVSAYPEALGAALLIFCVRKIHELSEHTENRTEHSVWSHARFGIALAYLPWVHEKMIPLSVFILLLYIFVVRPSRRQVLPVILLLFATTTLQMRYYWLLYGRFTPAPVHPEPFRITDLYKEGLWGLILDQKRGVMPTAPWFIAGITGLWFWTKRRLFLGSAVIFMTTSFLLITGSFGGWYGGGCAQPRYITNIMPFFAVGLALTWTKTHRKYRSIILGLCMLGIMQGYATILEPYFLSWHRAPLLRNIFPCVFRPSITEWLTIAAWCILLLFCAIRFAKQPKSGKIWNLIPVMACALILYGSAIRLFNGPKPRLVYDNIPMLQKILNEDTRFLSYNRRIGLARWLAAYSYNPLTNKPIPAILDHELRWPASCVQSECDDANENTCTQWRGATNAWTQIMTSPLVTMYDGSYIAKFRLNKCDITNSTNQTGSIELIARCWNTIFGQKEISFQDLENEWFFYDVPFYIPTPTRGVSFSINIQGRGCITMDCVKLEYLSRESIKEE